MAKALGGAPDKVTVRVEQTYNGHPVGSFRMEPTGRALELQARGFVSLVGDGPKRREAPGPSARKAWPLKMAPADYIAKYEGQDDVSDEVKERLALAREIEGQ